MIQGQWDRRIGRATELVSSYPFAAQGLCFYLRVATFQRSLYADIQKALADSSKVPDDRPLRDELDLFLLLPKFSGFLSLVQRIAPAPPAQIAAGLEQKGLAAWQHAVEGFWHGELETALGGEMLEAEESGDSREATLVERSLAWIFCSRMPSILPISASLWVANSASSLNS